MSTLVEGVARAKAARIMAELTEEYGDPRWQRLEFDSLEAAVEMNWEHRMPDALADTLAVLNAIADPSAAMHHAARDWSYQKYGQGIGKDASDGCYRAMIAAVRKEVEGEPT